MGKSGVVYKGAVQLKSAIEAGLVEIDPVTGRPEPRADTGEAFDAIGEECAAREDLANVAGLADLRLEIEHLGSTHFPILSGVVWNHLDLIPVGQLGDLARELSTLASQLPSDSRLAVFAQQLSNLGATAIKEQNPIVFC